MLRLFCNVLLLLTVSLCIGAKNNHPLFISVTEIEHNATDKTLEISCKIFTDDFEKTLRATYKTKVDLLNQSVHPAMDKLVSDYVQKHLLITVNGKLETLQYVGYEQIEEGIYSYYQLNNVPVVKTIKVMDNILYEYKPAQSSLVHITVAGKRQSNKLVQPQNTITVQY